MSKIPKKFHQAYAIAKAIPKRKNKRQIILAWCTAVKKALARSPLEAGLDTGNMERRCLKFERGFRSKLDAENWISNLGSLDWRAGFVFRLRGDSVDTEIVDRNGVIAR